MTTSEQIGEVAAALAKAQASMEPALKDSVNPAYRSKFAGLSSVWDACRKPMTANGLSIVQDVIVGDGGVYVTTRVLHASGQWLEFGPITVPLAKQDAHGIGSATTYGKRYGLSAAIGIVADEDDDGNAAVGQGPAAKITPVPPQGYRDWLIDLGAVVADGLPALERAWKESRADYRTYLNTHEPAKLEELKQRAGKVKAHA